MSTTHWHLRITLESSAKQQIQAQAAEERRSASNFVRILIERALTQASEGARHDAR